MARYIGLDAHSASCTIALVGSSGKRLGCHVVETKAKVLVDLIQTIPRPRHLCFEQGTHSAWLYEILSRHVDQTVVTTIRQSRGPKDDERDAFDRADKLRTNSIETRVYKEVGPWGKQRELARVQNRLKTLYRSRALSPSDRQLYDPEQRQEWISKLPNESQPVATILLQQYDALEKLRADAEKQMLAVSLQKQGTT